MNEKIELWSYTLRSESGSWLGQIVLTSDGMFGSVTDYGNFSYAWRHFGENFKDFIISLNVDYFASKMQNGLSYVCHNRQTERASETFAKEILPTLQDVLRKEKQL